MGLTFITGFRDRELGHVKRSLDSLQEQSCQDFQMIFIDYGSAKEISVQIQKLLTSYSFCKYYYSDTRGWLWNRSTALNTGARLSKTKYLFFTDIDILYDTNFVAEIVRQMKENVFIISDCVRVPKGFTDWENVMRGAYKNTFKSMMGRGIACYPKDIFEEIGGFDEEYAYWSNEDNDIAQRMTRFGLREIIAEELYSYHQWHPRVSIDTPYSLLFHNVGHYYRSVKNNVKIANQNQEWGKLVTGNDRPIYEFVDPDKSLLRLSESIFFYDANTISDVYQWAKELEGRENGLWAVSRNVKNNEFTLLLNKFLRRLNLKLDHSVEFLDEFAQGLVLSVPHLFRDYYLNCHNGSKKKYSLFMI